MGREIKTYNELLNYIDRTSKKEPKYIVKGEVFDYEGNKKYWRNFNMRMSLALMKNTYPLKELFGQN